MAEIRNVEIAQRLREVAALLNEQGANPFRVQAYRHTADTVQRLDRPAAEILQTEGVEGLPQRGFPGRSSYRSCGIWRHGFPDIRFSLVSHPNRLNRCVKSGRHGKLSGTCLARYTDSIRP